MSYRIRKSLYLEVADDLKRKIENGDYPPHKQLPAEVDLAGELGVSRGTLREALSVLEKEGVVYRQHGIGSFVKGTPVKVVEGIESLTFDLSKTQEPYSLRNHLKNIQLIEANEKIAEKLSIPLGSSCYLVELQIVSDNNVVAYFFEAYCGALFRSKNQLKAREKYQTSFEFLRGAMNAVLGQFICTLKSVLPKPKVMELLEVDMSVPVTYFDGVLYDQNGKPLMYSKQYYRGDKYQFTLVRK